MILDKSLISSIEYLVKRFRNDSNLELEVRFGTMVNEKFVAGLTRENVDKYLNMIQSTPNIEKHDWQEHHDFYYKSENESLRTRVIYNTDTLELKKTTIKKKKVKQHVFKIGKKEDNLAVKFSISEEIPYNNMVPIVTNTDHVRIQQRRTFIYKKSWIYDFSMIWSGVTKTEAEIQQKNEDSLFEFEIEMDRSYLINHDDNFAALSFLYKVADFVDRKEIYI